MLFREKTPNDIFGCECQKEKMKKFFLLILLGGKVVFCCFPERRTGRQIDCFNFGFRG